MTLEKFLSICESDSAPSNLAPSNLASPLKALWYDRRGEWDSAHKEIQDDEDQHSAAVHAYLHRKEGDLPNARYWYNTAHRKPFIGSLDQEWQALAAEFIASASVKAPLP